MDRADTKAAGAAVDAELASWLDALAAQGAAPKQELSGRLGSFVLAALQSGELCYDLAAGEFHLRSNPRARPSFPWIYMEMAHMVARRSTCQRLHVGTVVTSSDYARVHAVGYNGNYRGGPNACDSEVPGQCGCIHSEANALIKCQVADRDKVAFVTHLPCKACAKLIVNSGFARVFYRTPYRIQDSVAIFTAAGVEVAQLAA